MGPRPHLWICPNKTVFIAPKLQDSMVPRPHLWFCALLYRDFRTRITSLYGSQTSPTILCMQNIVLSIRNTSLYGSLPHLWFCVFKTANIAPVLQVSMGPRPHLWFCACKTAGLATEFQVSMGFSPHLWFWQTKQRL